jgi:hypothetical protein
LPYIDFLYNKRKAFTTQALKDLTKVSQMPIGEGLGRIEEEGKKHII